MRGRELAPLRPIRHNHEEVVVVRWSDEAGEVDGVRIAPARSSHPPPGVTPGSWGAWGPSPARHMHGWMPLAPATRTRTHGAGESQSWAPPKTRGHGSWPWRSGFPCKDGPQLLEYRVARALPIFLTRPLASSSPRIRIVLSFPKPASSDIWGLERAVPAPISE